MNLCNSNRHFSNKEEKKKLRVGFLCEWWTLWTTEKLRKQVKKTNLPRRWQAWKARRSLSRPISTVFLCAHSFQATAFKQVSFSLINGQYWEVAQCIVKIISLFSLISYCTLFVSSVSSLNFLDSVLFAASHSWGLGAPSRLRKDCCFSLTPCTQFFLYDLE